MQGLEGLRQYLIQRNQRIQKQAQQQLSKQGSGITRALISGNCVYVNNQAYPYTLAVDINVYDGMNVYCELCNGQAVIVGA